MALLKHGKKESHMVSRSWLARGSVSLKGL